MFVHICDKEVSDLEDYVIRLATHYPRYLGQVMLSAYTALGMGEVSPVTYPSLMPINGFQCPMSIILIQCTYCRALFENDVDQIKCQQ